TSTYAIRIYELLVAWFGRDGKYTQNKLQIKELREMLGIEDKYSQFGDFRNYVINPAIQQINENTDFIVSVDFIKKKRSYEWIEFNFERKPEIFEADKQAREERKKREEHNLREKYKRESKEAELRHKKEELAKLEAEREMAEQQKKNELEAQKEWAAEMWVNITEEQKQQMIVYLKQQKKDCFAEIAIKGIEENDENTLFVRAFSQFFAALQTLEIPENPVDTEFSQPENNVEPEPQATDKQVQTDDKRAD
ncbi:RepB family plasmid replication initiator protein, partial [Kingella kingae]|uniref:replication initiation protein n=1 Tax=Kingella kingae TaxID=504 RepID=UPI00254C52A7